MTQKITNLQKKRNLRSNSKVITLKHISPCSGLKTVSNHVLDLDLFHQKISKISLSENLNFENLVDTLYLKNSTENIRGVLSSHHKAISSYNTFTFHNLLKGLRTKIYDSTNSKKSFLRIQEFEDFNFFSENKLIKNLKIIFPKIKNYYSGEQITYPKIFQKKSIHSLLNFIEEIPEKLQKNLKNSEESIINKIMEETQLMSDSSSKIQKLSISFSRKFKASKLFFEYAK